jgi:hypothetical protein
MKNQASWDRIARVVGGVVLIGLGLGGVIPSPWGWVAAAVGGFCLERCDGEDPVRGPLLLWA